MTKQGRNSSPNGESGLVPIRQFGIREIHPSPENDRLYRPIDPQDPQIQKLAASIRERGILEPLVVSRDGFILSGHRRYCAAKVAGLGSVPCRVLEVSREDDGDDFVKLLAAYNMQRVKNFSEKLRESVVQKTPEQIYESLLEHRRKKGSIKLETIEIRGPRARAEISAAKQPFVEAVQAVIEKLRSHWPLSDRQIHYQLLNRRPLIHASKPDSTYANDLQSYKALVDLLTRGRLTGVFQWSAIADETRPFDYIAGCKDVQEFIDDELSGFLYGYSRDLMQSQPNHIEIVVEKNTVRGIVKQVSERFCIPLTSGRGFCSLPPRFEMSQRFRRSGKQNLVILIVSDFDPDGEEIAHSFARSMRDDFGIQDIQAIKVALTAEQVQRFNLPPTMKAKKTSTNYARFRAEHGANAYELEALEPEALQKLVTDAVDAVIDRNAFNAELDQEKQDAVELEGTRERLLANNDEDGGAA